MMSLANMDKLLTSLGLDLLGSFWHFDMVNMMKYDEFYIILRNHPRKNEALEIA